MNGFCHPVSTFWKATPSHCELGGPLHQPSHDAVDFTLCFEDTIILYGICCLFWGLASLEVLFLRQLRPAIALNWLNGTKLGFLVILFLTALCDLFYSLHQGRQAEGQVAYFQYLSPIAMAITVALAAAVITVERRLGAHSSPLLFFLWLGLLVYASIKLRTLVLTAEDEGGILDKFRFTTFCVQFASFGLEFVLSLMPDKLSHTHYSPQGSERKPCPEEDATFLSRLTWWWLNGLVWLGWKRTLLHSDLTDLNSRDKSAVVAPHFQRNWDRELSKAGPQLGQVHIHMGTYQPLNTEPSPGEHPQPAGPQKKREPSLVWALVRTFWPTMAIAAVFKLGQDLLGFASPQILRLLIQFASDSEEPAWKGYFYSVLLFLTVLTQSLFLQQYFYRCYVVGMRIRTAIIATVYSKALRLNSRARRTSTVGEIVNLMSVDAQRFMDLMTFFHMIWSAPFQIVLALTFLWFTLGPSTFAGFAVMVLLIPVNTVTAAIGRRYQMQQMTQKDVRIKIINEVLNGIKVIKLYAWELPFQRQITGVREAELRVLRKSAYLNVVGSLTWYCAPLLVIVVTFGTYVLVHRGDPANQLTAERAFVALSLLNIARFPLYMLPQLISHLVQASVSVKRLRTFLKNDELDPNSVEWRRKPAIECEDSVSVDGGVFTWDNAERPTLTDLTLSIGPGKLVAVVGQVGAGKSSLISALLGEMDKLAGRVTLRGSMAYLPQQAWILNATLRDNVLFGHPMKSPLYNCVLHACALEPDLAVLPGGDLTEIGEKGINLSGGQKQRVSLARAVYQDADIYLLDDPLSAVDSHVGKHIFEKVIGPDGMLRDKVRLLVTHSVTYLPLCDHIIVMAEGRIVEQGTYTQLMGSQEAFAEFLHTYANVEESQGCNDGNSGVPSPDAASPKRLSAAAKQEKATNLQGNSSLKEEEEEEPSLKDQAALITEEKAETGTVRFSVILAYCQACSYWLAFLVLLFYVVLNAFSLGSGFWLADWTNAEDRAAREPGNYTVDTAYYLGIYSLLGGIQAIFVVMAAVAFAMATMRASRTLHYRMLANILRAPMVFFDTTPVGRILNRFSKDIYTIDETIPLSLDDFLVCFFTVVGAIIVMAIVTPVFTTVMPPLVIFYWITQRFYISTSRQLKRIEAVSRSPIYSHFHESLLGVSSIRAYRQQARFIKESMSRVDNNHIAYYPNININRWVAVRLEFIGNLLVFFAALFATIQHNYSEQLNLQSNAGLVGLSVSYALMITQELNWLVRMASDLETNIIAVERTKEYSETPTEAPAVVESCRPPTTWPHSGDIRFEHYSTCYRLGLEPVLKNISISIPGGAKVGIVGRTGAGKSSMTLALFRIIEATGGAILIDNLNIAHIGLQDLRSRITIIPQDPVLFSGPLRTNLDPFNTHSDEEVWGALESAHLSGFVSSLSQGLQHSVAEGGENLSVGQRQLVCLARALLRKTKILVLDEATAAVDLETDDLIQKTIRAEFGDCTVLTIAHRINTIMDYDHVLVLQSGQIVEYGSPQVLLDTKKHFYLLSKEAGLVS